MMMLFYLHQLTNNVQCLPQNVNWESVEILYSFNDNGKEIRFVSLKGVL